MIIYQSLLIYESFISKLMNESKKKITRMMIMVFNKVV